MHNEGHKSANKRVRGYRFITEDEECSYIGNYEALINTMLL